MDLLQKLVPTGDNHLIYYQNNYGPTFGNYALRIYDCCNANNSSYATFASYNIEGPNKYSNNQEGFTALSGATNGSGFRVSEY